MPQQKPYNKHFSRTTFSRNHFQTTKHWQSQQVCKTVPVDCCEYPKKPAKASKLKQQRKTSIETTSRFSVLIQWERIAH